MTSASGLYTNYIAIQWTIWEMREGMKRTSLFTLKRVSAVNQVEQSNSTKDHLDSFKRHLWCDCDSSSFSFNSLEGGDQNKWKSSQDKGKYQGKDNERWTRDEINPIQYARNEKQRDETHQDHLFNPISLVKCSFCGNSTKRKNKTRTGGRQRGL